MYIDIITTRLYVKMFNLFILIKNNKSEMFQCICETLHTILQFILMFEGNTNIRFGVIPILWEHANMI